ncbi:MAG: dTMP kinase [Myxococcota bacterium]
MIEGHFIVLEGIDGAGTTTHTRLLSKQLRNQGLPVHATREPSDGPLGMMLRQILAGRVVVPGIRGSRPPTWTTMALLFAADRLDHQEAEIVPNLMDGVTVICDRYDYSSIAYQSVTAGGTSAAKDWILELNRHARRPDLTLILDVPAEVAARRREYRAAGSELYDDDELQSQLCKFYQEIDQHFPSDNIAHLDANKPVEETAAEILHHVRLLRREVD